MISGGRRPRTWLPAPNHLRDDDLGRRLAGSRAGEATEHPPRNEGSARPLWASRILPVGGTHNSTPVKLHHVRDDHAGDYEWSLSRAEISATATVPHTVRSCRVLGESSQ